MSITRYLISIIGKRAFFAFGIVTFLVAAMLATVNIASRHAVKAFVEDQLHRIPWDMVVYQTGDATPAERMTGIIRKTDGIARVEEQAFLRAKLPESNVILDIDGKPMGTPWMSVMAATDPSLFPPEIRESAGSSGAVLALVGPESAMGQAFLDLQGARHFKMTVKLPEFGTQELKVFNTPISKVIRMDRDQLNRWLMDQTGSISYVPHIGAILFLPYDLDVIKRFDTVATGLMDPSILGLSPDADLSHIQLGEYLPETAILAQLDRDRLITGWDIPASLKRLQVLQQNIQKSLRPVSARAFPDSTTLVLLKRMDLIARAIGILALLIALPLLWMAWVLAANLSGLLMLNERRILGLMRLRGVPGHLLGRAFLLSITLGGLAGGILGLLFGTVIPLSIYEHGSLPSVVLLQPQMLWFFALYLVITVVLALLVSRRLVRYATTISPQEASARVAGSEAATSRLEFGIPQLASLVLGIYTLYRWIFSFSLARATGMAWTNYIDQALNFIGLPFFIYGLAALLASHRSWIHRLLQPIVKPIGGRLGPYAVRHMSIKPHRTGSFLLIISLMASISLYPTITARSFQDKAERGAQAQMGADLQMIFNSPDLTGSEALHGELGHQKQTFKPVLDKLMQQVRGVRGVTAVDAVLEATLPNFYLPGHGLKGVPMYLIDGTSDYLKNVYHEPQLGLSAGYTSLLKSVGDGRVAVSPPVADFWRLKPGTPLLIGMDDKRNSLSVSTAGTLAFLSGLPPLTVTDRQGYVQARLDYLNHLFSNNSYLVGALDNPQLDKLSLLIPRVILLVKTSPGTPIDTVRRNILNKLTVAPLEVNTLPEEIAKVGSDMFIYLAMENMRIYLIGGLLLALIAILAVALANYVEDRHTLSLLRIRGASQQQMSRYFAATHVSPAVLGLTLGILAAMVAGYGLANYLWKLREIKTVVQLLPTHLAVSSLTVWIALLIMVIVLGIAWGSGWWMFRRTAREDIQEG